MQRLIYTVAVGSDNDTVAAELRRVRSTWWSAKGGKLRLAVLSVGWRTSRDRSDVAMRYAGASSPHGYCDVCRSDLSRGQFAKR